MARRGYQSDEVTPEDAPAEATPADAEAPPAPLTETQIKLNELDAYYAKVLGDLDRENREAHAVHEASEKRMADLEQQKAQVDAEYAERKAALEVSGGVPTPKVSPPTRWGTPVATPVTAPTPNP